MQQKCFYCDKQVVFWKQRSGVRQPDNLLTRDHLVPKVRGGGGMTGKTVVACAACNQDKGELTSDEYRVVLAYRANNTLLQPHTTHFKFPGERE